MKMKTGLYLCRIPESMEKEELVRCAGFLSEARRERMFRYRFEKDRLRCLFAGLLARAVLCRGKQESLKEGLLTAAEPAAGRQAVVPLFAETETGKPFLTGWREGETNRTEDFLPCFNLSHSGCYVLCSAAETENGVDIQEIEDYPEKLAARYFSPEEQRFLASLNSKAQPEAFYRLWCLKESFLKATGEGLSGGIETLSFSLGKPAFSHRTDAKKECLPGSEKDSPLSCLSASEKDSQLSCPPSALKTESPSGGFHPFVPAGLISEISLARNGVPVTEYQFFSFLPAPGYAAALCLKKKDSGGLTEKEIRWEETSGEDLITYIAEV